MHSRPPPIDTNSNSIETRDVYTTHMIFELKCKLNKVMHIETRDRPLVPYRNESVNKTRWVMVETSMINCNWGALAGSRYSFETSFETSLRLHLSGTRDTTHTQELNLHFSAEVK